MAVVVASAGTSSATVGVAAAGVESPKDSVPKLPSLAEGPPKAEAAVVVVVVVVVVVSVTGAASIVAVVVVVGMDSTVVVAAEVVPKLGLESGGGESREGKFKIEAAGVVVAVVVDVVVAAAVPKAEPNFEEEVELAKPNEEVVVVVVVVVVAKEARPKADGAADGVAKDPAADDKDDESCAGGDMKPPPLPGAGLNAEDEATIASGVSVLTAVLGVERFRLSAGEAHLRSTTLERGGATRMRLQHTDRQARASEGRKKDRQDG
jgi:hypothetical protein